MKDVTTIKNSLTATIQDCWQYDGAIPNDSRFMGRIEQLKIVVAAPSKKECWKKMMTSVRVHIAYCSNLNLIELES